VTNGSARYVIPNEEERPLLYAHCSRHLVGFISDDDNDFYGAGVIINIDGTWAIATAAHVATAISGRDAPCLVFPGAQSDPGPRLAVKRRYSRLCVVASDSRSTRKWRPDELDLAVIIPEPEVFAHVPGIAAVNLRLHDADARVVSGRFCIAAGLPRRLQDQRSDMIFTTNMVSSHFMACPAGARPDDVAINWVEVFMLDSGRHEDAPDAGGFSGGPVFMYVDDLGGRLWTPQRQLALAGILHFQDEQRGEYLLAHSTRELRNFITGILDRPENDEFRAALANGFRDEAV
jgi:hypothetical protein